MTDRDSRRRGGIVGPAILIALGVVFLLNNLGLLEWSVWEVVLRLWPILLIATGLDLILGWRSIWGSLLTVVLTAGVLVVALWLAQSGMTPGAAARTQQIAYALEDLESAKVVIDPGVGTISIEALTDSMNLVEGELALGRDEELEQDFSAQGDSGVLTLRTGATSFGPFPTGWTTQRVWELQLTPRVPLRLVANVGLGATSLNLAGLSVESVDVEHGLGEAVVMLPHQGGVNVRVEGAIGQTVVVIPEDLEARVRLDTGLAARQLPEEYTCEEDVCTSPGYDTADQPAELELGQAIGNLIVRH